MTSEHTRPFNQLTGTESFVIGKNHIDKVGHLNHVYWNLYLQIALKHLLHGNQDLPPLRSLNIKYGDQIVENDAITITSAVKDHEEAVKINQRILKNDKEIGQVATEYSPIEPALAEPIKSPYGLVSFTLGQEFAVDDGTLDHLSTLRYFEQERYRLLLTRGIDIDTAIERDILPMVVKLKAQFAQELKIGQQVEIRSQLKIYDKRIIYHQQMIRDGKVICESETTSFIVSNEKQGLVNLPADIKEQLSGYPLIDIPYSPDLRWM